MRTQENRLVAVTNSLARILVAEDETSLNDLLQDALRMNGYETISAKHGLEALRLIREEKPDLVILDINMPNIDVINEWVIVLESLFKDVYSA